MALEEEEESQNAPFCVLDGLFCEEESEFHEQVDLCDESVEKFPFLNLGLSDHDMLWDDDELSTLISKQEPCLYDEILDDEFLVLCREKALDWIFKVKSHYGFNSLTALLAVNYFDRFITSRKFQTDKPWMSQLTALACLSLAAKVEEIRVPFLLDFQVEEARYVFEAKTIQRMELLVLSTLDWRMHPVTPISFFDHIIRRYSFKSHHQLEFLSRCESLLLSIIPDSRFLSFSPSVLATAIMVSVIRDLKMCDEAVYQSQLMTLLKVDSEKVNKCYELVLDHSPSKKRMMNWMQQPASPIGVFDASFSSDSSNESWVWRCLTMENTGIIGLYGVEGVGKTTVLTQVNNRLLQQKANGFDFVLWVFVSKNLNLQKIQDTIREKIGFLDRTWTSKSEEEKAAKIFEILSKRRFALFLDDVWEKVDLVKAGVPPPDAQNRSKIVFTTCSEEVCKEMSAQTKIKVEKLAWERAWDLFKKNVGEDTIKSHPDIAKVAQEVAARCDGLPLALVTIGRAMASKKTPQEWRDALYILSNSPPNFSVLKLLDRN